MERILDIDESTDARNSWKQFANDVELLRGQCLSEVREPGHVSTGVRQTLDQSKSDRIRYVDGRNCTFEYRYADGFIDRLPALAAELVRLNPSVIVSAPVPANLAVSKATSTIPIVMSNGAFSPGATSPDNTKDQIR